MERGLNESSHRLLYPAVCWWNSQRGRLGSRSNTKVGIGHKNGSLKSAELSTREFSHDMDLKDEKELVVCLLWFEYDIFPTAPCI